MTELEGLHPAPGEPSTAEAFKLSKAQAVAAYLEENLERYVRLVECRIAGGSEILILDVEPERPQQPINDIRTVERLAVLFDPSDKEPPEVLALRQNFPQVPHLNLRALGTPKSLCLFEEPYEDQRLRWTAATFLRQTRTWLTKTARGELHAEDQPLEPLFVGSLDTLIIPFDLFRKNSVEHSKLAVTRRADRRGRYTLLAQPWGERREQGVPSFVATTITSKPVQHGVISATPRTFAELHDFLTIAEVDLVDTLRRRLRGWHGSTELYDANVVLLVYLPKSRNKGEAAETSDIWAFLSLTTVKGLGEALGVWEARDDSLGLLIGTEEPRGTEKIELAILNPVMTLSRDLAASLNNLENQNGRRIVAVGQGSLGSQVTKNLTRAAFGEWSLVDYDHYLPHNGARHDLPGHCVGLSKADMVALAANGTIDGSPIAFSIVADVLRPGEQQAELEQAYVGADVLLDMSASVAVARYLTHDVDAAARRVSLFLNPSGNASVLLAEDKQRDFHLDQLEMQYYRLLLHRDELADHFALPNRRIRYGMACRDVSAKIPQDLVALHAALGSRALKQALNGEEAVVSVWMVDETLNVSRISVQPSTSFSRSFGDWRLVWDGKLIEKIYRLRENWLPNETGGTLVGAYDLQRQIVYAVDCLPSPPDSKEYPTVYIRGASGLSDNYETIKERTAGMLEYIGEWHSHPDGHGCEPSDDDRKVFAWLTDLMAKDALPPLMLIAGDDEQFAFFLGRETVPISEESK